MYEKFWLFCARGQQTSSPLQSKFYGRTADSIKILLIWMVAQKCQDGCANLQLHRKSCWIDDVKTEMRVDDIDGDVIEKARRNKFLSLLIN